MEKTIGELIDELSICNLKIWKMEDIKRNPKASDTQIAAACKVTNVVNQQRSDLIEAIDKFFGKETGRGSTKSYGE